MAKKLVSDTILAHLAKFGLSSFFSKFWLCLSLGIMVSYHRLQCQEKPDTPILRKLSEGQTDGRTDGPTDESDFIGRCLTNVERPTNEKLLPVL